MLSNAYFLAKFRFDTADNEPAKNLQNYARIEITITNQKALDWKCPMKMDAMKIDDRIYPNSDTDTLIPIHSALQINRILSHLLSRNLLHQPLSDRILMKR